MDTWSHPYGKEACNCTHPCPNFRGCLVKPPLKLGHGWIIASHRQLWTEWLIRAINSVIRYFLLIKKTLVHRGHLVQGRLNDYNRAHTYFGQTNQYMPWVTCTVHWNRNVDIWTKFSSLVAPKVVKITTFGQPMMKISSKWRYLSVSVIALNYHLLTFRLYGWCFLGKYFLRLSRKCRLWV